MYKRQLQDSVTAIDAAGRKVTLASGGVLSYDRLVISPGVDFMFDQVPGLETEAAQAQVLHALSLIHIYLGAVRGIARLM